MDNRNERGSQRIGRARIVPLYTKIVALFVFLLLASNLVTNYVTLIQGRSEQVKLMNKLLVKELKENYTFASAQYEIYEFEKDLKSTVESLNSASAKGLEKSNSLAIGLKEDGSFLYYSSNGFSADKFDDSQSLNKLVQQRSSGLSEGPIEFSLLGKKFFGYYKFQPGWDMYLIRAEDQELFFAESWKIFGNVSIIILVITLLATVLGIYLVRHLFRFVSRITNELMKMQSTQELSMIDLKGAPADDITYLGLSFNALSSTVNNLMHIFKKFVTQDVASRAYKEREIKLEGQKQELTILFTDIKSFTFMTETLGSDIIKLLNLHYDKAIREIQYQDGIVGSIIGDALLAVFGTIEGAKDRRGLKSIRAAYKIQEVAAELRKAIALKRELMLTKAGSLSDEEERVYKAVMIEVGVGIDGGEVFYGNIGSTVRMTNTVIGDNVNSASRLEGLTRVYHVPVIVSEFVMQEVTAETQEYLFMELDQVQVKGKTVGKKIYWPIKQSEVNVNLKTSINLYSQGLSAYYAGNWRDAEKQFKECGLESAEIFLERLRNANPPSNWNGIWTMTSK